MANERTNILRELIAYFDEMAESMNFLSSELRQLHEEVISNQGLHHHENGPHQHQPVRHIVPPHDPDVVHPPVHPIVVAEPVVYRPKVRVVITLLTHAEYYTKMDTPCPICLEPYKKGISVVTECNHNFCHGCMYQLIKERTEKNKEVKCPMCRNHCTIVKSYSPKKGCGIRVAQPHRGIRENLLRIAGYHRTPELYSSIQASSFPPPR